MYIYNNFILHVIFLFSLKKLKVSAGLLVQYSESASRKPRRTCGGGGSGLPSHFIFAFPLFLPLTYGYHVYPGYQLKMLPGVLPKLQLISRLWRTVPREEIRIECVASHTHWTPCPPQTLPSPGIILKFPGISHARTGNPVLKAPAVSPSLFLPFSPAAAISLSFPSFFFIPSHYSNFILCCFSACWLYPPSFFWKPW